MSPRDIRPLSPRLSEHFLEWTLPATVAGQSIKGDLDPEYGQLQNDFPGKSFRGWYLREALKLGVRYGWMPQGRNRAQGPGAFGPSAGFVRG